MPAHSRYLPKLVLCVVGDDEFAASAKTLLEDDGVEFDVQEREPRMVEAFQCSASRVWPSLQDNDFQRIAEHRAVVYALSDNYSAEDAIHEAHEMLTLGTELLEAGGTAMKCESSGTAHSKEQWMRLADTADRALDIASDESQNDDATIGAFADFWTALVQAFVQLPIVSNDDYYTCGLHLLGIPDLIISQEFVEELYEDEDEPDAEAAGLMLMLAITVLMQDREEAHEDFEGDYKIDDELPEFRLTWEECDSYEEDDFFFNPFGRLRISSA